MTVKINLVVIRIECDHNLKASELVNFMNDLKRFYKENSTGSASNSLKIKCYTQDRDNRKNFSTKYIHLSHFWVSLMDTEKRIQGGLDLRHGGRCSSDDLAIIFNFFECCEPGKLTKRALPN